MNIRSLLFNLLCQSIKVERFKQIVSEHHTMMTAQLVDQESKSKISWGFRVGFVGSSIQLYKERKCGS